ncbi:MAG: putative maltokinase [Myxococcales bacterium]
MFYWFALQRIERTHGIGVSRAGGLPTLRVAEHWQNVLEGGARHRLEDVLPAFLQAQRWFGGKARRMRSVLISKAIPLPMEAEIALVTAVHVDYTDGAAEGYLLPLAYAENERASELQRQSPTSVVARVKTDTGSEGILYDALVDEAFAAALLETIANRRRLRSNGDQLVGSRMRSAYALQETVDSIRLMRDEQSNTSVVFSDKFILKVFRRLERGVNPDLEIGRFLTKKGGVSTPKVAGFLEHRSNEGTTTLGILHEYVPNQGSAWSYTLAEVERYYERALALGWRKETSEPLPHPLDLTEQPPTDLARDLLGTYLETARLLGTRTAELHRALASEPDNPDFAPEPFTTLYQRSLFQSMQSHVTPVFNLLNERINQLPEPVRESARAVLAQKQAILKRMRRLLDSKLSGMRIRHHGDYHLGQVLYTGRDFVILDFEGEPARPLSERKLKRSALRDVAGMLRSFHYAAFAPLLRHRGGGARPDLSAVEPWARFWLAWASSSFLKAYLAEVGGASFLPKKREEVRVLLDTFLLEKAVYELGYELNNRPDWVRIPLQGIEDLLRGE